MILKKSSITVVIPAYNEQNTIKDSITKIIEYFNNREDLIFDIVVVDDGSTDKTNEILHHLKQIYPQITLVENPANMGKGYSVRKGVLCAKNNYIFITDADLPCSIEAFPTLFKYIDSYDIVIGSKWNKGAILLKRQPLLRVFASRFFSFLVRLLVLPNVSDSQCGFKLFKRSAAQTIFAKQRIDGFCFDVEVLYLAREYGYTIKEVGIPWSYAPTSSKVHLVRDSLLMLYDLIRIKKNIMLHRYRSE